MGDRSVSAQNGPIVLATPFGAVAVYWSADGICRIDLNPLASVSSVTGTSCAPRFVRSTLDELDRYFSGMPVEFENVPVDESSGTAFQRAAWRELRRIPYGQTRSYCQIASGIGKPRAVRAVGSALGRNPVPIVIPCHRVIRKDGALGGFGAGLGWKRKLLSLESSSQPR